MYLKKTGGSQHPPTTPVYSAVREALTCMCICLHVDVHVATNLGKYAFFVIVVGLAGYMINLEQSF